jgi:hypothetical protein
MSLGSAQNGGSHLVGSAAITTGRHFHQAPHFPPRQIGPLLLVPADIQFTAICAMRKELLKFVLSCISRVSQGPFADNSAPTVRKTRIREMFIEL